jgi:hypothetical protein
VPEIGQPLSMALLLTDFSHSWVMLDPKQGFVRLPGEKPVYASPARTGLSLTTPRAYPGNNPLSIQSQGGTVYLTNQRVCIAAPFLDRLLTESDRLPTLA